MAASTKTLGDLHQLVAEALTEQVQGYEEADEEGKTRRVRPSPAVLGAAIAYLKNNNITADPEGNERLRALGDALKARREKRAPQAELDLAAEQFAASLGGGRLMQ